MTRKIQVVDSHTAGEPTRVIISGGPDLGNGSMVDRMKIFKKQFDGFRSAVVNEPRGSDVMVGALLVPPIEADCLVGVIFFNNVGYLGMCGHGTIGLTATLSHLGQLGVGAHQIETVVGKVNSTLESDGSVSVANVPSFRKSKGVVVQVEGVGPIQGDVAWGGNWFFLVENHGAQLELSQVESLTELAWRIRKAVNSQGYPEVDHVELFGPPTDPKANSRNFVLCPGKAYDRSPCGTGTSAKLACLAEDGKLKEGQFWVQESIIGSSFRGSFQKRGQEIIPIINGRAFVISESTLILSEEDPFCWGIRGSGSD